MNNNTATNTTSSNFVPFVVESTAPPTAAAPPPPPLSNSSAQVTATIEPPAPVDPATVVFKLFDVPKDIISSKHVLTLFPVLRAYVPSMGHSKIVPAPKLWDSYGKLKSLKYHLELYNNSVQIYGGDLDAWLAKLSLNDSTKDDGDKAQNKERVLVWNRYVRYHVLQMLSVFGFQISDRSAIINVVGLGELIEALERVYSVQINEAKANLNLNNTNSSDASASSHSLGSVDYLSLSILYEPGSIVIAKAGGLGGSIESAFRVLSTNYVERRTLFGFESSFHMQLEFVVSFGKEFGLISFEVCLGAWSGNKYRRIEELDFVPVGLIHSSANNLKVASSGIFGYLNERGQQYEKLGLGANYVSYKPQSIFLHGANNSKGGMGMMMASNSSGRIMVDVSRASQLGHYAAQGVDDATHALIQTIGRYKRSSASSTNSATGGNSTSKANVNGYMNSEGLFLFTTIPDELFAITWPALVGYSFTAKSWAHVIVTGLEPIKFNDDAFDSLVLDPRHKRLIRALVRYGNGDADNGKGEGVFEDVIAGKSGGSVFLLHGPSGCGKTLTAEAIAEVLHKPLYYVTMGELGVDPSEMEKRLGQILELCGGQSESGNGWDALVLLDEADVFLEKRNSADLVRNAMVCVMLRLLEYHRGILFLTTNRVTEFDPAFESRVTVALKYKNLDAVARAKVWENLLKKAVKKGDDGVDYKKLGEYDMNGRQIKNAVRLALALSKDVGLEYVTQEILEETISIAAMGREDIRNAEKW
jgi:hypothetical protein